MHLSRSRGTAGFLAAPPEPVDSETMGALNLDLSEPLLLNRVVGLTAEELDAAIEQDGEPAIWTLCKCKMNMERTYPSS